MRLSLGWGPGNAPLRPATAAEPRAPRLRRRAALAARTQYDVALPCYGTLGLSDTAHVESGELSCGAHEAQTARLA